MGWLGASLVLVATRGRPVKCGYFITLRMEQSSEVEHMLYNSQKYVKMHNAEPGYPCRQ
jgi:hypothetical protein